MTRERDGRIMYEVRHKNRAGWGELSRDLQPNRLSKPAGRRLMAVTMSAKDAGATSCGNTTFEALVISCERGGNLIPEPYRDFFAGHQSLLATHRGFDSGALVMARSLAAAFSAPLVYTEVNRLRAKGGFKSCSQIT